MRFSLARLLLLAGVLSAGACEDNPAGPEPGAGPDPSGPTLTQPIALPVLGQGAITARYSAEVAVRDGIAYTTTWGNRGGNLGNAIYIWDVSGAQPALVDSLHVDRAGTLGDVEVVDHPGGRRLLVVAVEHVPNGALLIYDLANPRRPSLLTRYATPNTQTGVHTAEIERVGGRLYGFLSIDPTFGDPAVAAKLVVVDLSDPTKPVEVFAREMGRPYVHDVFVRDGYLFTAEWDDGVGIWDIGARGGSPAAPTRISTAQTVGGNAHNVWWFHNPQDGSRRYAFVGEEQSVRNGSAGDVHVLDVTDLAKPREVAFFSVPGAGTHNFWVDEAAGILYAAYYNGGVRALDIRGDLGGCTDAQKSDADRTEATVMLCDLGKMGREVGRGLTDRPVYVWGVQQVGPALYASDMHNGLWKLDVAPLLRALGR